MKKRAIIMILVMATTLLASGQEHPFLFMTRDDIKRVRENAQFNESFEQLAKAQVDLARKIDPDKLPPFETKWREAEESKPYLGRTRAATFKHLRLVPLQYSRAARDCARAWVLTDDVAFLDKAKEILLKHSKYDFSFEGVNTGLDYAVVSFPAMEAYDIAYDRFTPQEHALMKEFFMRLVEAVKKDDDYWVANNPSGSPMNNHEGMHRACMAMVGFFYDLPEYVERAITGFKGFGDMLRYGFHDDGLWAEGSLPYNYVQLDAMLIIAELAHNAGYPVNLFEQAIDDGLTLKQCYDVTFDLIFPDGMLPPIGDGYGGLTYPEKRKDFELLYTRLQDPRYAWLINRSQERGSNALFQGVADLPATNQPPAVFSKLWLRHGMAALRSGEGKDYWNGDGYSLFANFSTSISHGQSDKLSIMLYAKGHLWLRDSESKPDCEEPFSSDMNQKLNWTTPSHNTISIDYKSHSRKLSSQLELREYMIRPEAKRITMGDLQGVLFKGVKQLRTCIVRDKYVLFRVQFQIIYPSRRNSLALHPDRRYLRPRKDVLGILRA